MTAFTGTMEKLSGQQREQHGILIPVLIVGLVLMSVASVATGAVRIDISSLPGILLGSEQASARDTVIVWSVRLPRTFLAMLVGASLAASGAVLQGLFRNPLADPGLVGVSSGPFLPRLSPLCSGRIISAKRRRGFCR